MQYEKELKKQQTLSILSREKISADSVRKIKYLSQETVLLATDLGPLVIKGENLFVDTLDSQTGEILIKGKINSVTYLEKDANNKFKRIFK